MLIGHTARRRTATGLLAVILAMALAGCGGAAPQAAPAAAAPPTSAVRPTSAPPTPAPATNVPPAAAPPSAVPPGAVLATNARPPTTPAPAPRAVVEIVVADNRYEPPFIEVPVGATVRWVNRGQDDHDVNSEDLTTIVSPVLKPGQSFEMTFAQPDSFPYLCSFHVGMNATLVVK